MRIIGKLGPHDASRAGDTDVPSSIPFLTDASGISFFTDNSYQIRPDGVASGRTVQVISALKESGERALMICTRTAIQ